VQPKGAVEAERGYAITNDDHVASQPCRSSWQRRPERRLSGAHKLE
jgi:hypothetical protein